MPDIVSFFREINSASGEAEAFVSLLNSPLSEGPVRRHPLGFHYIKVGDEQGYALRLHIWHHLTPSVQVGFEVHDHMFDMTSRILKGSVRQQTFIMDYDEVGDYQLYDARYVSTGSILKTTGTRVRLSQATDEVFCTGSTYSLPAAVFHRLSAAEAPTVTCVLTQNRLGFARSLGPAAGPLELVAERSAIAIQQRPLTLNQASSLDEFIHMVGAEAS